MPKHTLGIELGPQSLRFVQLSGTTKSYEVTAAGDFPLPHHEDQAEQQLQYEHALRELIETQGLQSETVVVTLPATQAALRNVTVPFTDPHRIRQIIKYTLDEYIPFEPDEIIADFQMLPATAPSTTPLLAAAIRQDVVADALSLCQAAGLEPTTIDLDVFALANAAVFGTSSLPTHTLLLDVRPTRTLLTLLQDAIPVYARSWTYGWLHPEVPPETYAARLSQHIQHTIYAYDNATDSSYVADGIVLSGMPLDEYTALATVLQDQLQTPVSSWHLSTNACTQVQSDAFSTGEQSRYAVAFGAATRGMYRQAVGIDLRREQFALHRNFEELRGHLIVLGCLVLLVFGLGLGKLYFGNRVKAQRHAHLQQEITKVFQTTLPDTRMVQPAFQLREKITGMQNRLRAFGGLDGAQLSVLQTLREISSHIPASLTLNVDTLTMTPATVDMSGTTTSYDDVVKLKDALESAPAIAAVKINTTKATTTNQVTFQLTISAAQQQGAVS